MDAATRETVFERLRWWEFLRRRRCPHVAVTGVWGTDVARRRGERRLRCQTCGRFLDGPIRIAIDRQVLVKAYYGVDSPT